MDSFSITAGTGPYQFTINHTKIKDIGPGNWITSPKFRVGKHHWVIKYYPQGSNMDCNGKYVSVLLQLQEKYGNVCATFEFALQDKNRIVPSTAVRKGSSTFAYGWQNWGWFDFLERTILEKTFVKDGFFVLNVSITLNDESCTGPQQNIGRIGFPRESIQRFREENKRTDVTFNVHGKKFVAHRLILAAHSPVFEAELFGSMAESSMEQILINEMMPSVFKAMLDFMYNGSLPDVEPTNGKEAMLLTYFLQNLLVAADRYAVENLKSICELKLLESISLDTALSLLQLAEKHNCSELKNACLEFIVEKDNSVSVMCSEQYIKLVQQYPSLLAELRKMASK